MRMGEFDENYKIKCECCGKIVPNQFFNVTSDKFKIDKLFRYGIDLVNSSL
jgi:hypothetical protein